VSSLPLYFWIAPITSIAALVFAFFFFRNVLGFSKGTERMQEIAGHVQDGAYAYLRRQYKVVGLVFVILVVILTLLAFMGIQNPFVPVAFVTGGFFSGLCGFIGMKTATEASSRTAWGAKESLDKGLRIAFRAGAVMGLVVVGFGLLDIAIWYGVLTWIYDSNIWGFGARLGEHVGLAGADGSVFQADWLMDPAWIKGKQVEITTTMLTFGMGASTQALFARVGGGIYTKAADVGADLVGKVEAGIPEDDPRNPATIADNVGDNVGDVAGMGADLYESYCGCILATAAIGASIGFSQLEADATTAEKVSALLSYVLAPMVIAGIGSVLSLIGIFLVRCKEGASNKQLLRALGVGVWVPSVLIAVAVLVTLPLMGLNIGISLAVIVGIVAGIIIGQSTEYYTSDEYSPTQGIAKAGQMGPATTVIEGMAVGFYSAGIPVFTICLSIFMSYLLAGGFDNFSLGLYGVGFSAVGMLATLGVTLATDAYGPIADNAGGNAEMAGLGYEVRERTDALDMLGNTTAATGKGFAIGSAGLTALALLVAYVEELRIWIAKYAMHADSGVYAVGEQDNAMLFAANQTAAEAYNQTVGEGGTTAISVAEASISIFTRAFDLTIMNPNLIIGTFMGAMLAFVFCAMTMKAVGRAAGAMVEEVRRQFREIAGIMDGSGTPEYAKCVSISTAGAQREMIVPSLMALAAPVVIGLFFGIAGVFGMLIGALATGFSLAAMLNNAGGAWDNAKKYVEKGHFGGKGSETHKSAVIGDTIGDPFKDTSGPSLNILIKIMSMVSVVFAGVIVAYGGVIQGWLRSLMGS
jgi:K(+)-stimulated pyrophosphate-energized sodium pump